MECVVFSIDGSFAASVSIMGSDPKVRAGAVDVVRQVPATLQSPFFSGILLLMFCIVPAGTGRTWAT